jgi:hypothetical protein
MTSERIAMSPSDANDVVQDAGLYYALRNPGAAFYSRSRRLLGGAE